jgi:hypothetical protein
MSRTAKMTRFLQRIAAQIRERFDSEHIDAGKLATLYQSYHHLEDINNFVARGLRTFPHFCCGLASAYLRAHIGRGQITYGRYHTNRHSFLLIDNTMIVDITADQFGGPKVYVGPLESPWSLDAPRWITRAAKKRKQRTSAFRHTWNPEPS